MKLHEDINYENKEIRRFIVTRLINIFEKLPQRIQDKHKDFYKYHNFIFKSMTDKGWITCPIHGDFLLEMDGHVRGVGCRKCANERRGKLKRKSTEQFILEARIAHGDKYDYSLVVYIDSRTEVIIICPIHGEFKQRPDSHTSGYGCGKCGFKSMSLKNTYSREEFIDKSNMRHNFKYDYSKSIYINSDEEVYIICPTHGGFWQEAKSHMFGKGCSDCADYSFKTKSPAILYYICIDESCYKIGITGRTIKERYSRKGQMKKIRIIKEWKYEIGQDARDMEKFIVDNFKESLVEINPIEDTKSQEIFTYDILELDN